MQLTREGVEREVLEGLEQQAALEQLRDGGPLVDLLSRDLATDPASGFFFECAPFVPGELHRPFRYVVVESPSVAAIRANPKPFADHLSGPAPVVRFLSLRRDAELVVPVPPPSGPIPPWGHLAAFLRDAPADLIRRLWADVGAASLQRLDELHQPMWLSTSGLGVPWLHLRLDSRPKYFTWAPYRQA